MADVTLTDIHKSFGSVEVIKGVDLSIASGEFVVFVGKSGCGKTTLLRMIAGLEDIDAGELRIDSQPMNDVPPAKRELAMVFQSYALYPHMSVFANLSFSLKLAGVKPKEIKERVHKATEILQITDLLDRLPKQLSGGQRQRVAIGRAIVREPKVFLFDEPLSNLDAALRSDMRVELADLHKKLGNTMIYVTHDQVEAMTLADKIVVMNEGCVEQVGSPIELYSQPQTQFVAGFIGSPKMNFIKGKFAEKRGADICGIRPEHIKLSSKEGEIKATLKHLELLGADSICYFESEEFGNLLVRQEGIVNTNSGNDVYLSFELQDLHLFKNGHRVASSAHLDPIFVSEPKNS